METCRTTTKGIKRKIMTSYQILIDTVMSELFNVWKDGANGEAWSEENAREISKIIVKNVEVFKIRQTEGNYCTK